MFDVCSGQLRAAQRALMVALLVGASACGSNDKMAAADGSPDAGDDASMPATSDAASPPPDTSAGSVVPAAAPSGITLSLDAAFYAPGDGATVTLDFGPFQPSAATHRVSLAAPDSGDVELVEVVRQADGTFRTAAPLKIVEGTKGSPYDDTLQLARGSMLVAIYFVDRDDAALANVSEQMIADTAFLEASTDMPIEPWVDTKVTLSSDEANDGPAAKPTGTLIVRGGQPLQLATHELILYARNAMERDRFLAWSGGQVQGEQPELDENGTETGVTSYLVAVDPKAAKLAHLPLLRTAYGETEPLLVSKPEVLGVLTLALEAQLEGFVVSVNPRLRPFAAPSISATETTNNTFTMKLGPAGCVPGDATRPCVFNVPALWSYLALVDRDDARIPVGVLDMGFAPNQDFRDPATGARKECDFTENPARCEPGAAVGTPTVGASFVGERVYHGTGVVTTLAGVVNNGFGASGVAGQVAVPMLYEFDTFSYAFEMGAGMRRATLDGASCINVSAGYPCRVLTNVGPDFDVCSASGRTGVCTFVTATIHAAAALICATVGPIPIVGAIACGAAQTAAAATTTACVAQLALGEVRGPMYSGVQFATRNGVPIIASAGNPIPRESLPEVLRDYVNLDIERTEDWGMIPATLPNVITVGAVGEDTTNLMFHGDRVDIWAPISSAYLAPEDAANLSSSLSVQSIGGSSAAAPYVAGVVAAMQAVNPDLNPRAPDATDETRALMVGKVRALLLDKDSGWDDAELVALGFPSDAKERRFLVDPIAAVQAAARGKLPDFAALGYDTSLGFSELAASDDTAETARTLEVSTPLKGTIVAIGASGSATSAPDVDFVKFTVPASPAQPHETVVTLTKASSIGGVSLTGQHVAVQSNGGPTDEAFTTYRVLAAQGATVPLQIAGPSGADTVYRIARNASAPLNPSLAITSPTNGSEVCANQAFNASASASYPSYPSFTIASSSYAWTRDGSSVGSGATRSFTLTAGAHTLAASVFGATQTINVTAVTCSSTAPVATITSPASNNTIYAENFDQGRQRYYVDVLLQASATDAEDGTVSSSGFRWTTDRTDIQTALLGTGNSITVRLYSAQGSNAFAAHKITLIVTDSSNTQSAPVTRTINVDVLI